MKITSQKLSKTQIKGKKNAQGFILSDFGDYFRLLLGPTGLY